VPLFCSVDPTGIAAENVIDLEHLDEVPFQAK